jgi:hypothetical protein
MKQQWTDFDTFAAIAQAFACLISPWFPWIALGILLGFVVWP